jgi:tetratricopeptide (TPR) repeat protein
MNDAILIVQVHHPQKTRIGEFIYRFEQPAVALGKMPGARVVSVGVYSPSLEDLCRRASVVVWHMASEQDLLPLMEWRKREGLPNVFEISDSFIAFEPHDPMKEFFSDPIVLATTLQYVHLADAVQTTTEELARTFGFLNRRFMVFENQLAGIPPYRRRSGDGMTIGWGGSLSHLADLRWIAPTVTRFCRDHPDVRFSYMGARKGLEYFSSIPRDRLFYTPPGTLEDYYRFLSTLDVGLAPLLDTTYNRCRSDVKYLEYAAAGLVPVLSDLPTYRKHGENRARGLLFSDEVGLVEVLERLHENPGLRQEVAERAHHYVKTQRLEEHHGKQRLEFYRSLMNKAPVTTNLPAGLERIQEGSEAFRTMPSEAERAMTLEAGDLVRLLRLQDPHHYLPYLKAGESLLQSGHPEAARYLALATERGPRSLRAHLLLAMALLQTDRPQAYGKLTKALEISSGYAPAWDGLGRLREQAGDYEKASQLFQKALEANPFYSPAMLGFARACLAQGQTDQAAQALRTAMDVVPDHPESRDELRKMIRHVQSLQGSSAVIGLAEGP